MNEYFKARLTWRAGIESLSDAEAGRLAKAIWRFAETGEETTLTGGEKYVFAMCLAELKAAKTLQIPEKSGKKGGG